MVPVLSVVVVVVVVEVCANAKGATSANANVKNCFFIMCLPCSPRAFHVTAAIMLDSGRKGCLALFLFEVIVSGLLRGSLHASVTLLRIMGLPSNGCFCIGVPLAP
jgi:hypothetical protein